MTHRRILDDALGAVGETPLIRLDRIRAKEGLKCNLLAKMEYASAGGSLKDRIAKRMVNEAEREGKLIPGQSVVIEPTSGNTGVGLAMACAIKGYPLIITMSDKMSMEKEAALRALGAEVIRTPADVPSASPESLMGVAQRLEREIPGGIILNQYSNPNNPLAHEETTAPEIIDAINNTPSTSKYPSGRKVDVIAAGVGTGGTITGMSKAIQRHNPEAIVVGIDPCGSVLAYPDNVNDETKDKPYVVEGIGYDFYPDVLERNPKSVHEWVKTTDAEAFEHVKMIMRNEGMLVGGSSGSVLSGTLRWLRESESGRRVAGTEGMNVVIIFADGIRNYMSKPWFSKLAMEGQPSPLADQIRNIMKTPDANGGKEVPLNRKR